MPELAVKSRRIGLLILATAAALALVIAPAATSATAKRHGRSHATHSPPRIPIGFIGTMVDGPMFPDLDQHIDLGGQMDVMVASGVESIRVVFDWAHTQPYATDADVPSDQVGNFVDVGGVPTDWASLDQVVGLAAQHGLTVLPVVLNAPEWDADHHNGEIVVVPKHDRPFANFLTALVQRYGPHGSFWAGRSPKVPIRSWQIWNEPNIQPAFWPAGAFAPRYVALLRAAHNAIKHADPRAKVVLAGLPNYSWVALRQIYKVHGARGLFDVVAIHPYTQKPQGVITILSYARQAMDNAGDARKPMIADEVSWPSTCVKMSHGKCTRAQTNHDLGFDFTTTEKGQAANLAQVLPLIAKNRVQLRLAGFYWYTWAGLERPNQLAFDFAGLFRFSSGQFIAKPAFGVFRRLALGLERCRQKGTLAPNCVKPF